MGNKILVLWCAIAFCIIMGASTHIKHKSVSETPSIILLPIKCQEQAFASPAAKGCLEPKASSDSRTSEIFLRKVLRKARRLYA